MDIEKKEEQNHRKRRNSYVVQRTSNFICISLTTEISLYSTDLLIWLQWLSWVYILENKVTLKIGWDLLFSSSTWWIQMLGALYQITWWKNKVHDLKICCQMTMAIKRLTTWSKRSSELVNISNKSQNFVMYYVSWLQIS